MVMNQMKDVLGRNESVYENSKAGCGILLYVFFGAKYEPKISFGVSPIYCFFSNCYS